MSGNYNTMGGSGSGSGGGNNNNNSWIPGAVTGVGTGLLGMIGAGRRARKAHARNKEMMGIQFANQLALNEQGQRLQMQTWRETGYPAQMKMMKEAGLNPALMYGMSGGGGQTTGSQGGGSAAGNQAHAPMEISSQIQAGLEAAMLKAQTDNIEAQTEKTKQETKESDSRVILNKKEADKKVEEIIEIGLRNKENKATMKDNIEKVAVELLNAKLEGYKTNEEAKAVIEKVNQDWEKLLQSGEEVNIKKFEAKIKEHDLWKVLGEAGHDVLEDVKSTSDTLKNWLYYKLNIGEPVLPKEDIPKYKLRMKG